MSSLRHFFSAASGFNIYSRNRAFQLKSYRYTVSSSLSRSLSSHKPSSGEANQPSDPDHRDNHKGPLEIEIPIPKRVHRENEPIQVKINRLVYQSRKRGILESDLLCSTFAKKYMHSLTEQQLDMYDKLLDENDWDLYYWASGEKSIPERLSENEVLLMMKKHFKNEGRDILRMPDLHNSD